MNKHDGDFIWIVGSDEIKARFFGEAIWQEHILDDQIVEVAHFPIEVIGCGPIGSERMLLTADADRVDRPAFCEMP